MADNHAKLMQTIEAANTGFAPDYKGAIIRPSPNFGDRREGKKAYMLIMHYTGMESAEAAERLLTDPDSQVSAHYLVREDGTVVQLVQESKRAWHAGVSFWQGERDVNSCSIGIEIAYPADLGGWPSYPAAQIKGVIALSQDIIARHAIKPRYVLGHSDIAPERKIDPGEKFPWRKIAKAGIGLYVPPARIKGRHVIGPGASGSSVEAFQSMLALYGYNITVNGEFDAQTEVVTKAFQRHFRPRKINGVADMSTIRTLRRLLARLGCSISIS